MLLDVPNRHTERKGWRAPRDLSPHIARCDHSRMAAHRHFIRAWREYRGLTQEQFAERIGINRAYLSKIETGKRRYDQPFLEAAADVLRCDPADLIVRDPRDPEGIWSIWDTLAPAQRVQVVEIAKTLKRTGTDG